MSELAAAPVAADVSAGTLLRRAREASGLHVAALAVSLKVPVRKLEALEEDRYDDMGDAVFIRGLASSVCRTLKVDPQPILQRLPQAAAPRLVPDFDGLNAPFRAPSDALPETWVDRVRQPVPATVIGLLAAAVVIYFVPIPQLEETTAIVQGTRTPAAQPESSAPAPAPAADPAQPLAAVQAVPAPVQPAPMTPAPPAASDGILSVRVRDESWVEVVDAKGNVAARKLMAAGEALALAALPLPLQVTIGRADAVEVQVRGARFDLRPVSRDNVARFEVK